MIRVPQALVDSDDYAALSDKERASLTARVNHYQEIANSIVTNALTGSMIMPLIDDVELDVLAILSVGDAEGVSCYRVHSSWTFGCDGESMRSPKRSEIEDFLASPTYLVTPRRDQIVVWLERWKQCISLMLAEFSVANSFCVCVGCLVRLDALMATFLMFATSLRLNASGLDGA